MGRPMMDLDREALAVVRLDGPSLVARVRPLQGSGGLGAVGKRLQSVTFTLPRGGGASGTSATSATSEVSAALSYSSEEAAAFAEVAVREALGAVSRSKREGMAWLASARVERPERQGTRVVVTAPLPPALVDALLHAGNARMGESAP
jgi:hypothetical protein